MAACHRGSSPGPSRGAAPPRTVIPLPPPSLRGHPLVQSITGRIWPRLVGWGARESLAAGLARLLCAHPAVLSPWPGPCSVRGTCPVSALRAVRLSWSVCWGALGRHGGFPTWVDVCLPGVRGSLHGCGHRFAGGTSRRGAQAGRTGGAHGLLVECPPPAVPRASHQCGLCGVTAV